MIVRMIKATHFILITLFACLLFASPVLAKVNPWEAPNNRFGIHIIDENDLNDAASLVNSSGGDWGYVKMVIREDDRNLDKWQQVFDRMRQLHLIPIIRIATKIERGIWVKPRVEDIGSWIAFLSQLNWVTENRYVIIFNEPNHAKEWGGEINPEEYAWYLKEFSRRLKEASPDFFILPAGLDASAPNSSETMDEAIFWERAVEKETDVFDFIDGWTSHSYPNPDYSGSSQAYGRGTVRTFIWEKEILANYGVPPLPIFITETGWRHNLELNRNGYMSPQTVALRYKDAFNTAWGEAQIVAITPFLLNYQDNPFDSFSFKKKNSPDFYSIFDTVQSLPKVAGNPSQHHSVNLNLAQLPDTLVTNSEYTVYLEIENTGQSLIGDDEGWTLTLKNLPFAIKIGTIESVSPYHRTRIPISFKTPEKTGRYNYQILFLRQEKIISETDAFITLIPPPSLLVYAKLWPNHPAQGDKYKFKLYGQDNSVIYETENLNFIDGFADLEGLYNIIPNNKYKFVLFKPYYLPSNIEASILSTKTGISFPVLLPLDPSNDGKLNIADIPALFRYPLRTFGLLLAL